MISGRAGPGWAGPLKLAVFGSALIGIPPALSPRSREMTRDTPGLGTGA